MNTLSAFVRSALGRLVAGTLGLGFLAVLIYQSGPSAVWAAVVRAPLLFPVIVGLQGLVVLGETWCTLLLYGPARKKVPLRELWRSSLFCFAVCVVSPFGRAVGEATRATMLSRYVGSPLAAAVATQVQAVALLGNAIISLPCALAVYLLFGPGWLLAAIGGNFVLTGLLGAGVILAGRHSGVGHRLGRFIPGGQAWGTQLDGHLKTRGVLGPPLALVFLCRIAETGLRMVVLVAVGGAFGVLEGLSAEGISLVSGVVGDVIPAQVGVMEMTYSLTAKVLSISAGDGVAMGLLSHVAALVWVGIGFLVPLVMAPRALPQASEPQLP